MDKIKFAIIGCGSIGKRHVAVVDSEERAELVAICDLDEKKCIELSELYNVPYYLDYKKMLSEVSVDVVNIATPHAAHAPIAIEVAKAKKNILVEKPMALTTEDGLRMIQAAKENNVKLYVVKQNRFNIPIKLTKEALDSNKLGRIFMVKCDVLWNRFDGYYKDSPWRGKWSTEGGAVYTQASHFIDLLIWWFGDVISADGYIDTKNHDIEIEDCGSSLLKFSSGAICSFNWTTCVYNKNYEGSITIIGEFGTIKIGGQYLNKIEYWDVHAFPLQEGIDFSDKPNSYGKYQGTSSNHDKVIKSIIGNLKKENDDVVEGPEGLKSITAIELLYKNSKNFSAK
jgi:UDP-N-acetyl-2-amino-2-deoxyglucuronate dehydrogenase